MAKRQQTFLDSPKLMWPVILALAALDSAGLFLLSRADPAEAEREALPTATPKPAAPEKPPPPAMINPPPVADMLRSGTLIVISKKSQNMFVFSDGALWASAPVSTGKRRHETPSGVFPILQKRRFHRSNLYSNAPMPFMQRLTWDGIALHSGRVPGYPASHGCVRMPHAIAQSLFKLTNASATTVVIGDEPLETDGHAQQFALFAKLPIRAALAPPPPPVLDPLHAKFAAAAANQARMLPVSVAPSPPTPPPALPPTIVPVPPPAAGGQTVQLTAAVSQAEAEALWARLLSSRPEMKRFARTIEPAIVKSQRVYRLRISGADAHSYCATLRRDGISCFESPPSNAGNGASR